MKAKFENLPFYSDIYSLIYEIESEGLYEKPTNNVATY